MKAISSFMSDERGAALAEYALLLALIAVTVIGAIGSLRDSIIAVFNKSASTLASAGK